MPARGAMLCPGPWPTTARVGTAGSAPTALQTAAEAGTSEKCPKCYNSKSSEIGQKRINVGLYKCIIVWMNAPLDTCDPVKRLNGIRPSGN